MSAIKHEFHEVIAGEYGAVEALEAAYHEAYKAHEALHNSLPVYRSVEQQKQLTAAYNALDWAKWKLDQARFWNGYHARNRA